MFVDAKICGLKTPEAVAAALAGGARWLGFVFHRRSPRHVEPDLAAALVARLPAGVESVAVSVDAGDDELARILAMRPAMLQLHGAETPARVAAVKARTGLPVVKAIAVSDAESLDAAKAYESVADALLLDAKAPKSAAEALPGGNGVAFDWRLLEGLSISRPWFLSGGLTSDNVAEAVARTRARRVDVSSGVEEQPGVKSPARIMAFLEAAKGARPLGAMTDEQDV